MVSCGSHKPKKLVRFQPIATKKSFLKRLGYMKKVSYICNVDSEVGSINGVSKHSRKCSTKKSFLKKTWIYEKSFVYLYYRFDTNR